MERGPRELECRYSRWTGPTADVDGGQWTRDQVAKEEGRMNDKAGHILIHGDGHFIARAGSAGETRGQKTQMTRDYSTIR